MRHGARMTPATAERDTGTVLIVAMWVILVLVGLVLVFTRAMRVEAITSANYVASQQAQAIAQGALRFVLAHVEEDPTTVTAVSCEAIEVGGGYFWILRPGLDDDQTYEFGIGDEAARVSLNAAREDMLLELPGMTAELAAAILDWRDEDSDVSPNGAEREYYLLLDESDVDALIAHRSGSRADLDSIAWVAEALPKDKATAIGGSITTRSCQFSADIVALSGDGRGWARYRAAIDTREGTPRVVFWQDLSHLGWPLNPAIREAVRGGGTPDGVGLSSTGGAR